MNPVPARWVIATANPGKEREIREILDSRHLETRRLAPQDGVRFPEEGLDYEVNAIEKARTVARHLQQVAVGDDSGLEVDALAGAPGPLSARYGGEGLDDVGRAARLLAALADVAEPERTARFVCVAAWADPSGRIETVRGECRGRILEAPRGDGGFGYDPVFLPDGHELSMAELPADVKNRISHRARAFLGLWECLEGSA